MSVAERAIGGTVVGDNARPDLAEGLTGNDRGIGISGLGHQSAAGAKRRGVCRNTGKVAGLGVDKACALTDYRNAVSLDFFRRLEAGCTRQRNDLILIKIDIGYLQVEAIHAIGDDADTADHGAVFIEWQPPGIGGKSER